MAQPTHLTEPDRNHGLVDLEFNAARVSPEDGALLAEAMMKATTARPEEGAGGSSSAEATPRLREALARHMAVEGWQPLADQILLAGSGRQAIAGAIAALTRPGQPLGVEALTYPMTCTIARTLGRPVVTVAMDAEGLTPEAVAQARHRDGLRVVYAQPTLHNPVGATMSLERRQAIAEVLRREDMFLIEDAVYGYLKPLAPPPIAAFAPERVILVNSLSKRGFSGLPLGALVVTGDESNRRLAASLRSGAWLAPPLPCVIYTHLLEDGAMAQLADGRRRDAAIRQDIVREGLAGLRLDADPGAQHAWLHLPPPWRPEAFAARALQEGVKVTASPAFAVVRDHAPDAVRLALAKPSLEELARGIKILADIVKCGPAEP
jgi:DNA-binding transcriptional MocR family regulator